MLPDEGLAFGIAHASNLHLQALPLGEDRHGHSYGRSTPRNRRPNTDECRNGSDKEDFVHIRGLVKWKVHLAVFAASLLTNRRFESPRRGGGRRRGHCGSKTCTRIARHRHVRREAGSHLLDAVTGFNRNTGLLTANWRLCDGE